MRRKFGEVWTCGFWDMLHCSCTDQVDICIFLIVLSQFATYILRSFLAVSVEMRKPEAEVVQNRQFISTGLYASRRHARSHLSTSQGWEERLRNDQYHVEWNVKR